MCTFAPTPNQSVICHSVHFCTNSQPMWHLCHCLSLCTFSAKANASLSHFQRALLHQLSAEVVFMSAIQCALLYQLPTKLFFFLSQSALLHRLSAKVMFIVSHSQCALLHQLPAKVVFILIAPTPSAQVIHSLSLSFSPTPSQGDVLSAIANEHFCTNSSQCGA